MEFQKYSSKNRFLHRSITFTSLLAFMAIIFCYFKHQKTTDDLFVENESSEGQRAYKNVNQTRVDHLQSSEVQITQKFTIRYSANFFEEVIYNISLQKDQRQFFAQALSLQVSNHLEASSSHRVRRSYSKEEPQEVLRENSLYDDQRIRNLLLERKNFISVSRQHEIDKKKDDQTFQEGLSNHKATDQHDLLEKYVNFEDFYEVEKYCKVITSNKSEERSNATHESGSADEHHEKCESEIEGGFPVFWTVLYIFVVLCLFIGLAIICDIFFVPSLEAISEKLQLSEDVAGATFMAAGSSAPELFTSIAGMGTGSDVGVGTIVGSAVFNLLIIIALTSILADQVLQLDWRPLIRDSIFYGLSVGVFIIFSWDAMFVWWESLCLLLLYTSYIVTMKFNTQLMEAISNQTCSSFFESNTARVSPNQTAVAEMGPSTRVQEDADSSSSSENKPTLSTSADIVENGPVLSVESKIAKSSDKSEKQCQCCCSCKDRSTTRSKTSDSSSKLQTSEGSANRQCPPSGYNQKSHKTQGDDLLCSECSQTRQLRVTFREESTCSNVKSILNPGSTASQFVDEEELDFPDYWTSPPPYDHLAEVGQNVDVRFNYLFRKRCRCQKQLFCTRHEAIYPAILQCHQFCCCCCSCFSTFANHSELSYRNELVKCTEISNRTYSVENDVKAANPTLQPPTEDLSETETQNNFSKESAAKKKQNIATDEPEAANETPEVDKDGELLTVFPCLPAIQHQTPEPPGSSHCGPSARYILEWMIYLISFPWVCFFTWTVPDCSKDENKKWYLMSFFMSIVWIAGISYVMVEIVERIGCLMNIDNYTMGLVVIAVGTSVPDAVSSILVAKAGHGDMAISNAIGSNVFDINLGLGLPFLLSSTFKAEPVHLLSPMQQCLLDNISLPIKMVPHVKFGFILLLILILCLVVFFLVRFKLNRVVGYLFITMYVTFMIYAFVQEKSCRGLYC